MPVVTSLCDGEMERWRGVSGRASESYAHMRPDAFLSRSLFSSSHQAVMGESGVLVDTRMTAAIASVGARCAVASRGREDAAY